MEKYFRLKDLREDAEKSQAEVAKVIGTSQSYYAQYENGKRLSKLPHKRPVSILKRA